MLVRRKAGAGFLGSAGARTGETEERLLPNCINRRRGEMLPEGLGDRLVDGLWPPELSDGKRWSKDALASSASLEGHAVLRPFRSGLLVLLPRRLKMERPGCFAGGEAGGCGTCGSAMFFGSLWTLSTGTLRSTFSGTGVGCGSLRAFLTKGSMLSLAATLLLGLSSPTSCGIGGASSCTVSLPHRVLLARGTASVSSAAGESSSLAKSMAHLLVGRSSESFVVSIRMNCFICELIAGCRGNCTSRFTVFWLILSMQSSFIPAAKGVKPKRA
mmetsp:Transcript_67337/g.186617  ORF Transcript_67337/g.186617 Transcript_67337/m.186617 type:complete len:272 (+) Transcript_67337:146-961(+)